MHQNKKSAVWKYFKRLNHSNLVATCSICHADVFRTSYNTTSLIGHLQTNHEDEYMELMKTTVRISPKKEDLLPQGSKKKKTSSNRKAKFNALNDRLFDSVEKVGVILRLLRKGKSPPPPSLQNYKVVTALHV